MATYSLKSTWAREQGQRDKAQSQPGEGGETGEARHKVSLGRGVRLERQGPKLAWGGERGWRG